MVAPKSETKWWLAAFLLPLAALIVCYAIAMSKGGYGGLPVVVYGFIAASLLCCSTAIVSFWRKERLAAVALLPALVSICFLAWFAAEFVRVRTEKAHEAAAEKAYRKQEEEKKKKPNQ